MTAVVVTWNSREPLGALLDALLSDDDLDVVVIDNASSDGTAALARARGDRVRVIENATNRGLAAANNQGIACARGEFVLIANPDTVPRSGAVTALADLLRRRPQAAFAIPRLLHADGSLQTSAGDLPSFAEALLGRRAQRRRGATTGFWWDGWPHDAERRIGRGHEAFYLVRRSAIDCIGPQDEQFFLDWEGIDWTARATDAGWEVWFTPRAEVVHLGGASLRQVPFRWITHSHLGMYRYFAMRRPRWHRPFLAAAIAARGVAKSALQGVTTRRGGLYGRSLRRGSRS